MSVPLRAAALLAAALLVSLPRTAMPNGTAEVTGKISLDREGVGGARVFAYESLDDMVARRHAAVSEPSGEDGIYRLELPAGAWYLNARAEGVSAGGDLFSYHGSNPFFFDGGSTAEVSFPLVPAGDGPRVTISSDASSGILVGTALFAGEPVEGARVKLYLDGDSDFRGMPFALSPPTGPDGDFRFDMLPESSYWVVAHRRTGGAGAGPLGEGDAYGFYAANPVSVTGGAETSIALAMAGKGADTGGAEGRPLSTGTLIRGRIRAGDGTVVPGSYAFAYRDKLMSHTKPDFLSREADGEGGYVIHVSGGGTFYVGARTLYGDAPARGEWYGRYNGTPDHAVTVKTGETLEGVDITVEQIIP